MRLRTPLSIAGRDFSIGLFHGFIDQPVILFSFKRLQTFLSRPAGIDPDIALFIAVESGRLLELRRGHNLVDSFPHWGSDVCRNHPGDTMVFRLCAAHGPFRPY